MSDQGPASNHADTKSRDATDLGPLAGCHQSLALVGRAVRLLDTDQSALTYARRRCRHLLVDEYQDINAAQYRLLRLLAPAGPSTNLCAVGDPDQAIYGFRGSNPSYFGRFATDYPGARTLTLARNYRSVASVVCLATAVIERTPDRVPRPLQSRPARGSKVLRAAFIDLARDFLTWTDSSR